MKGSVLLASPRAASTVVRPVFVLGAKGLLAGETMRLVLDHPALALGAALTRTGGESLADVHPQLALAERTIARAEGVRELARTLAEGRPAVLVLALPHGEAAREWSSIRVELGELARELLVLDLSADHRLHAAGAPHPAPEEASSFVWGLPELRREELRTATRIAAPGCFATALCLAAVPVASEGLIDRERTWCVTAVTGSSGSGMQPTPTTHHPRRHDNLWAYALHGHRHEAELFQALAQEDVPPPELVFVPHSGPFVRGIHLTALLPLTKGVDEARVRAVYERRYLGAAFVEVLAQGVPDLGRVVGSNRAVLGLAVRERTLIVLVALDNVLKGGAGQALQALNLALGLPETTGLPRRGLGAFG